MSVVLVHKKLLAVLCWAVACCSGRNLTLGPSYQSFKWKVSVVYSADNTKHFCDGVLIKLDKMLTTCRCTVFYKDEEAEFKFPLNDKVIIREIKLPREAEKQVREPLYAVPHPGCRSARVGSFKKDVAVWFTETPFDLTTFLAPIEIAAGNEAFWNRLDNLIDDQVVCQAVGWLAVTDSSHQSYYGLARVDSVVDVQLLTSSGCDSNFCRLKSPFCSINIRSQLQFCAVKFHTITICDRHLGGALVCNGIVYGLLSWSTPCDEQDAPTIYSALDVEWASLNSYPNTSPAELLSSILLWLLVTFSISLHNCF